MSLSLVPTLSLSHMERDNKSAHTDLLAPVSLPQIEATDLLPQIEATDLLAVRLDRPGIFYFIWLCVYQGHEWLCFFRIIFHQYLRFAPFLSRAESFSKTVT